MAGYRGRGVHGDIVERLGREIVRGVLSAGQTLDISELESKLQVSRTAIRETLRVLAAKGLVDARPRRGTYVLPESAWAHLDADLLRWKFEDGIRPQFLSELAEVRDIVEPAAARLAASRRTETDIAGLWEALQMMEAAGIHNPRAIEADINFHRRLMECAHNGLLAELGTVVEIGLRARDKLVHSLEGRSAGIEDSLRAHQAVFDAVRRGRPAAAATAMRRLLETSARDAKRVSRVAPQGKRHGLAEADSATSKSADYVKASR